MITICDNTKDLYRRIQLAREELKRTTDSEAKLSLLAYIDSLYDSISLVDEIELCLRKRNVFGSNKKYNRFVKKINLLENEMNENYILNKDFISKYIGRIVFGIEKIQPIECDSYVDRFQKLSISDFNDIFYQFMKSIYLDDFFDRYLKNNQIFNYKSKNTRTLGYTLYNIVNDESNIFIDDFVLDIKSLFILSHEIGHVYDLKSFNNDIYSYNRFLYQSFYIETCSMLFEKLLSRFLINNNILKDEAKTVLLDSIEDNYNFLLKTYIFSLFDESFIRKADYINLDKDEFYYLIKDYFKPNIKEVIGQFDYFDLQEDTSYAIGSVISSFLLDSINNNGFNNELINNYVMERSKLFNKDFIIDNGLTSDNYIDLYKKELKLMKK